LKKSLVLLLAAGAALMGAAPAETPNPLVTHTELGYVRTGGNTDTTSFSMDFTGKKSWNVHSLKLNVDALYGTENGIENNNKIFTELNYDWQFEKRVALNYVVGYKDDKFSGFAYQFYTGPGAKYDALGSKKYKLDLQGNILYNINQGMNKYYDAAGNEVPYPYPDGKAGLTKVDGTYNDYWGYMLRSHFSWVIVEGFKFIEEASYRSDFDNADNYFVYSKTAVESKINSIFSMGVSYKVNYTNLPPKGNKRTDTTFMVSLIIDY
jgi:putative salt-induced outer membrane protein